MINNLYANANTIIEELLKFLTKLNSLSVCTENTYATFAF
jgi:hypothetical protein